MAVKGVPLDLSRKLKTEGGLKVKALQIIGNSSYPLKAEFISGLGSLFTNTYTREGFFYADQDPSPYDLIYDDEILNNEENKTMKLEVYQEPQSKEEEPVRLRLIQHEDKGISLCAVDKDGVRLERGTLLIIRSDGSVSREAFINAELGFKINEVGKIEIN